MLTLRSLLPPMGIRWIVLGALLLRLISVPLVHRVQYTGDEREYIYLAKKIAHGEEFVDSNGDRSVRAPLFPAVLGLMLYCFGPSLLPSHILGCVLGAIVVWLSYVLGLFSGMDHRAATIAAAAVALYPGLVVYSGLLQTETLYIVLVMAVFILLYAVLQTPVMRNFILLGIFSGAAALTRPVFFGFFPLLILSLIAMRKARGQKNPFVLFAAIVAYLLVLLPWTIRNTSLHGELVPLSSHAGRSLLIGNNPYATGTPIMNDGFEAWFKIKSAEHGVVNTQSMNEIELSSLSRDIAIDYILSNPLSALTLAVKKAHVVLIYPITHSATYLPVQALAVGMDFLLLVGAAVGFVATFDRRRMLLPFYCAMVYFFLVHIVLHAEARFRLPMIPLFCLFFGWGIGSILERRAIGVLFSRASTKVACGGLVAAIVIVYAYTGWLFISGTIS